MGGGWSWQQAHPHVCRPKPSRTALLKGVMVMPCSIRRALVSVSISPIGPMLRTKCPIGYCESPGQESMHTTILHSQGREKDVLGLG